MSFSIPGLDPAGLWHTNVDAAFRLDPNDAHHVDVIHTDTGSFGTSRSGTVGHIDFFPNGGDNQPGCRFNIFGKLQTRQMARPEYTSYLGLVFSVHQTLLLHLN